MSFFDSLGIQALFGADLENTPNPLADWEAVLDYAKPGLKASAFKVPHHGSSTSQNARIWTEILEERPFSVAAPWSNGGGIYL